MNKYEHEIKEMELNRKEKVIFSTFILFVLILGSLFWASKPKDKIITPNQKENVKEVSYFGVEMLKRHEGIRDTVYLDTKGNRTIGIGFNLNKENAKREIELLGLDYYEVLKGNVSLTDKQIDILFTKDYLNAVKDAKSFLPDFDNQPKEIKEVVINMAFNLGCTRLNKFKKFRQALVDKDYKKASDEMVDSKWYNQVGNRSKELVNIVRNV